MPPSGVQRVIGTPARDCCAVQFSRTVLELEFWSVRGLSAEVREAADVGIPSIDAASAQGQEQQCPFTNVYDSRTSNDCAA